MLKNLYDYQSFEVAEKAIADAKKQSPEYKQLVKLKADFSREKEKYLRIEQEVQTLDNQRAAFPGKLAELAAKIEEEKAAIYDGSVVNVKELSAREAQVAALTEKLKEMENLNELYLSEYEQKVEEKESSAARIAAAYDAFTQIKEDFQKLQVGWQEQTDEVKRQREELKATIAEDELAWYERMKNKCNGTPIAKLNSEHVCSGCFTIVPPITFKRTCLGQETYCEKCGRILFVDETVGDND